MPDWEERITTQTAPAIRVEHELRYRVAAPLVHAAAAWADLGCGTGIAAAAALGDAFAGRAVLIDVDAEVVAGAARTISAGETVELVGDLSDPETLERVSEALLAVDGERTVTCFEVVEHLPSFVALVQWSVALARNGDATFLLSAPNDAFWAIDNPHHRTTWGEGSFEELRRLLPADAVLLRQVALHGSAIASDADVGNGGGAASVDVELAPAQARPTHLIAAFGPRADRVAGAVVAAQTDQLAQRRFEREREADLAYMRAILAENTELTELVREHFTRFEQWRTYIHELEAKLGLPLSGTDPEAEPEAEPEPQAGREPGGEAPPA